MMFTKTGFRSHRARGASAMTAQRLSSVIAALLGAILISCIPQTAVCAPINYGSHTGNTVSYIDVTEDSTTGDALPLFGAPIFSADSLDFNPVGFDAAASGAGGSDATGSRLTFMVMANAGTAITNISFFEAGQTTLAGTGTDSTSAQVTANGTLTISEVDGSAVTPIVRPIALAFSPSGGTYGLASDGGGLPVFHTPWSGALVVNIGPILTSEGVPFAFGATKLSIDIENTLTAQSEAGTSSLVSKKDFGGISITVNIPEPSCLILAGVGVFGWASRSRGGRRS